MLQQCGLSAGNVEEGVVSLYSEEVGMWDYNLSGVGLRPGVLEPTRIAATLGSDGSSFVTWRNPFVEAVKVPQAPVVYSSHIEPVLRCHDDLVQGSPLWTEPMQVQQQQLTVLMQLFTQSSNAWLSFVTPTRSFCHETRVKHLVNLSSTHSAAKMCT